MTLPMFRIFDASPPTLLFTGPCAVMVFDKSGKLIIAFAGDGAFVNQRVPIATGGLFKTKSLRLLCTKSGIKIFRYEN